MVHCDLKPANILVELPTGIVMFFFLKFSVNVTHCADDGGEIKVKLLDFDLCRPAYSERWCQSTWAYRPPEWADAFKPGRPKELLPACDIWSLGSVLMGALLGVEWCTLAARHDANIPLPHYVIDLTHQSHPVSASKEP